MFTTQINGEVFIADSITSMCCDDVKTVRYMKKIIILSECYILTLKIVVCVQKCDNSSRKAFEILAVIKKNGQEPENKTICNTYLFSTVWKYQELKKTAARSWEQEDRFLVQLLILALTHKLCMPSFLSATSLLDGQAETLEKWSCLSVNVQRRKMRMRKGERVDQWRRQSEKKQQQRHIYTCLVMTCASTNSKNTINSLHTFPTC